MGAACWQASPMWTPPLARCTRTASMVGGACGGVIEWFMLSVSHLISLGSRPGGDVDRKGVVICEFSLEKLPIARMLQSCSRIGWAPDVSQSAGYIHRQTQCSCTKQHTITQPTRNPHPSPTANNILPAGELNAFKIQLKDRVGNNITYDYTKGLEVGRTSLLQLFFPSQRAERRARQWQRTCVQLRHLCGARA